MINPDPQKKVIKSIFSLKKINPIKVAKINFEKSKGIILVIFERLIALVQKKFPRVPNIARLNNKIQ